MKKFLIGISVVVVFIAYSYVIRHNKSAPVIAPSSIKSSSHVSGSQTASQTASSGSSTSSTTSATATQKYKDGTYDGSSDSAYYGIVQVQTVIRSGKITAVNVLESPNENPNSVYINSQALPYLKQETIKSQNANIDVISGATLTSQAFIQSLTDALKKAE